MFKKPFVVLDLETSGIDPKNNDIIEMALIRYENGKEVARMDSLIKIDYVLPKIITAITGITDEEIRAKGQPLLEVIHEAEPLLSDAYLIGHNINFDVGFLKSKGVKLDVLGLIDTVPLAQILIPSAPSYSLESLASDLGIEHTESHRAMGDVEATLDLFKHLLGVIDQLPKETVAEIQKHVAKSSWESGVVFSDVAPSKRKRAEGAKPHDSTHHTVLNDVSIPPSPIDLDTFFKSMAQSFKQYEERPQQQEMAKAVLNAFEHGYHLIAEAPTGVGKSLAYLAAAAETALRNKSKVVISTNTLNLQQQLYEKDVPLLLQVYKNVTGGSGLKTAVLKGRSHYLCLRRLAEFKRRPQFNEKEVVLLTKILVWQAITKTGDSGEIHITREESLIWDFELSADKKYCSPVKCQAYGECGLHRARALAETADLLIVNHALLCADLESGGGLLPEYQYLIVDEAHHFEEAATDAFSCSVGQESIALPIKLMMQKLEELRQKHGTQFSSLEPLLQEIPALQQFIDNFFSVIALFTGRNVPDSGYEEHLLIDSRILGMPEWTNLETSMEELYGKVHYWLKNLRVSPLEFSDELLQEMEALEEQLHRLKLFFSEAETAESEHRQIRWMSANLSGIVSLHIAPLLTGPRLKEMLYDQKKSIILTSATLATPVPNEEIDDHRPFGYLRQMLGLDDRFEELLLDSPFNFETQAYVLLPTDMHPLTSPRSMGQVTEFFVALIQATGGGTLGLFTAYSAIETLYLNLINRPEGQQTHILGQRISGGRNKIMKAYLADPTHSVLLGTSSFWEGIDIKGEGLTSLIIHKLPFDVPSEPIFAARRALFGNAFIEYAVPRAVLRFRQGFGRLIRSKRDYGCLVVLDNRLTTKDFGQCFIGALPKGITVERTGLMEIPNKIKKWLLLTKP
ncbi:MAG: helicase C-terminal domain-containing protein [Candidatus Peregrinibacteria bacterium]